MNILHFQGLSFRIVSFRSAVVSSESEVIRATVSTFHCLRLIEFTVDTEYTQPASRSRFSSLGAMYLTCTRANDIVSRLRASLSFWFSRDSAGQSDDRIGHVEVLLFIECHIINLFRIKTFCGKFERLGIVCRSGNYLLFLIFNLERKVIYTLYVIPFPMNMIFVLFYYVYGTIQYSRFCSFFFHCSTWKW